MSDEELKKLFFSRGCTKLDYDIRPLIEEFSFYDLARIQNTTRDGFVVITDFQQLSGYCFYYGEGNHLFAFANTAKAIYGINETIKSDRDILQLNMKLRENGAIMGRITITDNVPLTSHVHHKSGCLVFLTGGNKTNPTFTTEQYLKVVEFYSQNNDAIKHLCKVFNEGFYVAFTYIDEQGNKVIDKSDSLDHFLEFVKRNTIGPRSDGASEHILFGGEANGRK